MCLSRIDEEVDKKILRREGKYIVCWKVVRSDNRKWGPLYCGGPYKPGWNETPRLNTSN